MESPDLQLIPVLPTGECSLEVVISELLLVSHGCFVVVLLPVHVSGKRTFYFPSP